MIHKSMVDQNSQLRKITWNKLKNLWISIYEIVSCDVNRGDGSKGVKGAIPCLPLASRFCRYRKEKRSLHTDRKYCSMQWPSQIFEPSVASDTHLYFKTIYVAKLIIIIICTIGNSSTHLKDLLAHFKVEST